MLIISVESEKINVEGGVERSEGVALNWKVGGGRSRGDKNGDTFC